MWSGFNAGSSGGHLFAAVSTDGLSSMTVYTCDSPPHFIKDNHVPIIGAVFGNGDAVVTKKKNIETIAVPLPCTYFPSFQQQHPGDNGDDEACSRLEEALWLADRSVQATCISVKSFVSLGFSVQGAAQLIGRALGNVRKSRGQLLHVWILWDGIVNLSRDEIVAIMDKLAQLAGAKLKVLREMHWEEK